MTFEEWWEAEGRQASPFGTAYKLFAEKAWNAARRTVPEEKAIPPGSAVVGRDLLEGWMRDAECWRQAIKMNMIRDNADGVALVQSMIDVSPPQSHSESK